MFNNIQVTVFQYVQVFLFSNYYKLGKEHYHH
jgi:hypothetical protein